MNIVRGKPHVGQLRW